MVEPILETRDIGQKHIRKRKKIKFWPLDPPQGSPPWNSLIFMQFLAIFADFSIFVQFSAIFADSTGILLKNKQLSTAQYWIYGAAKQLFFKLATDQYWFRV